MDHQSISPPFPLRPEPESRTRAALVPLGLIALGLIPALAGTVRLFGLASGTSSMPDHARFAADPLPAVLHIVSATLFSLVGALQLVPTLRQRGASWHRRMGRVLAPAGVLAALSGVWLTFAYPVAEHDSATLRAVRLVVAPTMVVFIALGMRGIRERDFAAHGRFMTRAYALGLGAGTQAFVLLPQALLGVRETSAGYAFSMTLGWVINALFAEWIIHRGRTNARLSGLSSRGRPLPRST